MATKLDSLNSLFPNASDFLARYSKALLCLGGGNFESAILNNIDELPISISKLLTGSPDEWIFPVMNGRSGSIATAVNGATINAASTIEVQYSLVASPAAADWKTYDNGSFTGAEVNKQVEFVGVLNRIVWTPAVGENLNVMVSL